MAGYVEVSDADRRWAASNHDGRIFRGPLGPFLTWVDQSIDSFRAQPPVKQVLIGCAAILVVALVNVMVEDEHVAVLVRGQGACAMEKDLLQKADHKCRVEDKLALGFLRNQGWVECGDFSRGAQLLQQSKDADNNFWYDVEDKHKVAFFYSTCIPKCASGTDDYRADLLACEHGICDFGLCKVGDQNAIQFMEGKKQNKGWPSFADSAHDGYNCKKNQRTSPGLLAIELGTTAATMTNEALKAEGQQPLGAVSDYWYDPSKALEVRRFYSECEGPCACNDVFDPSSGLCLIVDQDVRIFFDTSIKSASLNPQPSTLRPDLAQLSTLNPPGPAPSLSQPSACCMSLALPSRRLCRRLCFGSRSFRRLAFRCVLRGRYWC
jgi:hypothetical protein